ncbi:MULTISPECIES: peptidylprolyl isomerase [Gammaproteobacteria]|uniref:peptidylprolyl isomerase n=1 Tax=Gammaproteobacteria TaxID=1236 RepID=UPI000DCFD755|nr:MULTISPECIES: peptidylprolyl isomerase [Gammaproteobacteria]RTE86008.1 peptidyl-prolyl cis-trans isomerase [Aliidiomarina sp. B3213]TCZ91362.1 peptidyl-prolyl cis-trans isomerase [Lysobacter sp. N42]
MFRTFISVLLLALSFTASSQQSGEEIQPNNLFPRVKFVTSHGELVVELNRMRAPIAANNFLGYVADGSYNNTLFHRVVVDFVVQGGGFDTEWNELPTRDPIFNESGNGLTNRYGTIAMARQSDPHSATRQFYFNVSDNDTLNPSTRRWGYTVFGEVVSNMPLLDELAAVPVGVHEAYGYENVPIQPLILERVEIIPAEF